MDTTCTVLLCCSYLTGTSYFEPLYLCFVLLLRLDIYALAFFACVFIHMDVFASVAVCTVVVCSFCVYSCVLFQAMEHTAHDGELLVGLADNSFQLYNLTSTSYRDGNTTHQSAASVTSATSAICESPCIYSAVEHRTCIQTISVNSSGSCALTTSMDETLLWNLDDFTIIRTLHGAGILPKQRNHRMNLIFSITITKYNHTRTHARAHPTCIYWR